MKTVFLFIPNYVHSFDLLRTKYIEYLSSKYKVVVFFTTDKYINTYYQFNNIEYKVWQLEDNKLWGRMKLLRISLIKEFDNLLSIKLHYKTAFQDDWRRRFLRAVALIWPFNIRAAIFTKMEQLLLHNNKKFQDYLDKYKPSIILTCTPGFTRLDAEIIILSKKNKIKTAAINFSWDNLTTNSKHIRKTDYLIAWNDLIKKEATSLHRYKDKEVFVSGVTRFDYYFDNDFSKITKEEFIRSKNLDPNLKTILLTTTSHGVYPYHKELVEMILKSRDRDRSIPMCNFFIRVHPKDSIDNYIEFNKIKNVHVELAGKKRSTHHGSRHNIEMDLEDFKNLKNTLKYSDIAVNYSSTITLEAFAFKKPVINIGFPKKIKRMHYQYLHYKKIIESGSVRLAENEKDLAKYINLYYKNPETDKEIRDKISSEFLKYTDEQSYKRSVDFLEEIIN